MPEPNKTQLENAIEALRRGFAVFPCQPRAKCPYGKLVPHGVSDATHDDSLVRKWWMLEPASNIGVAGGVIVDCDAGLNNLQEAKNFALLNGFPPTLTIRTGRRSSYGVQFHFAGQATSGNYCANNVSGEVRSGNMYGLWAGSIHPISKEQYEIVIDLPRAACPLDLLMEFRTDGSGSRTGTFNGKDYEAIDIWTARERYTSLLYKAANAQRGRRNHMAHAVTFFAARGMLAGIFKEQTFQGELLLPGFSEAEVKTQIYHAVKSRYTQGERNIERMLRDSWNRGIKAGRLLLDLYEEDYQVLSELADDERFQRAWDGDVGDFSCAIEAKNYMLEVLTNSGATDAQRIVNASRIGEMVSAQLLFELNISRLEGGK